MGGIISAFIGFVIVLWLAWFFTGGPAKYEREQAGPYIKPPAIDGTTPPYKDPYTGETYGDPETGYKDYFKSE